MRPHQACTFGAGRGSQPAIRFPLFLKAGPPKNNLFWRNRVFFPVASRSNPRCSKAQIASYLAQIRRFLAPAAWASSTSTTKKISPQATFRKGSRRFRACFFWAMVGKGPWLSLTCLRHHRFKQYNDIPMGGIEPLHIPMSLGLKVSPNPSWNRGGQLASKGHARKVMSPPTDSFISESGPPKNNLFWRNRVFFPVASRSNPRCSKAQIASYLAQIRRFLAPTAWASSTSTTKENQPASNASVVPEGFAQVWVKWFQVPQARTKSRPPDVKILRFDLGKETSPNIATPRVCPWFVFSQSTSFRGLRNCAQDYG